MAREHQRVAGGQGLRAVGTERAPIDGSHAEIEGLEIEAMEGQGRRHRITHVRVTRTHEDDRDEAQTVAADGSGTKEED